MTGLPVSAAELAPPPYAPPLDRPSDHRPRSLSPEHYADPLRYSSNHWDYLQHPVYGRYQQMHKMFPGPKGAVELMQIADALSVETDSRFLSAAASAYVEAAIILDELPQDDRLALLENAEQHWCRALAGEGELKARAPELVEYTSEYRLAMNLACLPMVQAMVQGDVTKEVIHASITNLLQIVDLSKLQMCLAQGEDNEVAIGEHLGLQHEINALVALLFPQDPKYIAIPSSDRAGSGYSYTEQTHDIVLISQHFGTVRNMIPIEIKAHASKRDRERYRALLIRGKMHLSLPGLYKPEYTTEAFERHLAGTATAADIELITAVESTVAELMSKYKQGGQHKPLRRKTSRTHYYNNTKVADRYVA